MPGVIVTLPWPCGVVEVGPNSHLWDGVMHGGCQQLVESTDPNDHYRPWLERHVGKQRWDWDWRYVWKYHDNNDDAAQIDRLIIKIRKKKAKWASLLSLKYA